jgi:hypothetical protein
LKRIGTTANLPLIPKASLRGSPVLRRTILKIKGVIMKKALMLAGLVLCTTMGFAAETRNDSAADGKKRNEEAYEKMLEQTGWKIENLHRENHPDSQHSRENTSDPTPSKSS